MHKAWYYTSTVKVSHFEWLIMYRSNGSKIHQISFTIKQVTITGRIINILVDLLNTHIWLRKARTTSWFRLSYDAPALSHL